jgi:uncharacterized membrane protein
MSWKTASHLFFALTMIAVGVIGFAGGSFAPILAGVPKTFPDRQVVAHACNALLIVCGAGLLAKRSAAPAALVLLLYLIVWTLLFKVPLVIRQPLVEVGYQTCGENLVLIAGAWILYVSSASQSKQWNFRIVGGQLGIRIAHRLYGLALIAFGLSHFAYLNLTAPLVPAWLPAPVFWAYLTGTIYVATGIAVVTGIVASLGAALSALQIAIITLLVWGPMVLAGHLSRFNWQETVVSWSLTAAAWVVATSYVNHPWLKRLGFGALPSTRLARS